MGANRSLNIIQLCCCISLTIVGVFGADFKGFLRPLLHIVCLVLCGVEIVTGLELVHVGLEVVPASLIIGLYQSSVEVNITSLSLTWNS